jgi:polynucleotide 5'-hydroxyl-kinase GRC3/NOL9
VPAGGVCLLLGAVDTGKTTFCAALASAAAAAGRRVAVVDADVGQSDVGPPACVGMGFVTSPVERLAAVEPSALYFVGSTSPAGHLLPAVVGARAAVEAAQRGGADLIVVDTTGMVNGPLARALKLYKLDALRPDHLVALQRHHEVEHLLAPHLHQRRPALHRLPVSPRARGRSREQRAAVRQAAFRRYFRRAADIEVDLRRVAIQGSAWRSGERLSGHLTRYLADQLGPIAWAERDADGVFVVLAPGAGSINTAALGDAFPDAPVRIVRAEDFDRVLVGVIGAEGETVGMGILTHTDFGAGRLALHTPVREGERIAALRLGSLRVAEDYRDTISHRPGATG